MDVERIIGLVYDTTSVNTGVWGGIVRLLEQAFGRRLLQLPCRHHIYELVCGAAAGVVYGSSNGPNEQTFKVFAKYWDKLDQTKHQTIEVKASTLNICIYVQLKPGILPILSFDGFIFSTMLSYPKCFRTFELKPPLYPYSSKKGRQYWLQL